MRWPLPRLSAFASWPSGQIADYGAVLQAAWHALADVQDVVQDGGCGSSLGDGS
jgi:hypothetical protein